MKRTLSLILSLLMVLSLFTGLNVGAGARVSDLADTGAEAEIADTGADTIYSVAVTGVIEPVAGAAPSYYASVPSDKGYQVENYTSADYKNGVAWYNYTDEKYMTANDTFVSEKQYIVYVYLKPADNSYSFASNVSVTLNGKSASFTTYSDGTIEIYRPFTCPNVPIDSVEVTGVVEPIPGESPVYAASVPSGAHYRISDTSDDTQLNGIYWSKCSVNGFLETKTMRPTDSFVDGEIYTVSILVESESDQYRFLTPGEGETFSSTINGRKSTVFRIDKSHVVVRKDFICHYDLCLGSTVVTEANKNDILGDGGKAKFDPVTHTLTLNDPVISGVYERSGQSYKIFTSIPLTIKGSYHMTKAESDYGIYVDNSLGAHTFTVNADLTVYGEVSGIYGYYADININSNVTSKGGTNGISGTGCDLNIDGGSAYFSGYNYGIRLDDGKIGAVLNISGSVESVTAEGTAGAFVVSNGININNTGNQNVRVIEPDGGIIKKSGDYYYVYESDGATIANHALFSSHTPISSADCVVTEPVGGQQPDKTAVSGDSGKYNVSVVNWFKGTGDSAEVMTSRERFIAGETYSVRVRYTALDSYTFTGETNYTVNGKSTTYLGRNTYEATFTATVPPQPILAADCLVTEPVSGQTPKKTAVSGDSGKYSVEVINWYKGSGDSAELMPSRATFTAGETYSVRVRYTALDGYYLTTVTEYTINGESPTYLGRGVYEATFTAIDPAQPKPIAAISCTVTEPIAGQKPDYTAVPADSTKYTATVNSWIKGTGRTARTMSADETFIAGETYQVQVKFTVMTGYTSTDDTVYTIDGKTPTKITGREIYYSITFTNTPTAILGDVDFDGNIEIRDATWIQRSVADIEIPFVIKKLTADVDGDNNITVMDATAIQYYLANMKNPNNIGKTL